MSGLIDLPEGRGPGTWHRYLIDESGDNPRWSAIIECPDCSRKLPIPNHAIAADGQVTPSVGHDPSLPPCSWHVSPKLLGWAPVPPPPAPLPFHVCERCGTRSRALNGWGVFGGLLCPKCIQPPDDGSVCSSWPAPKGTP